LLGLGGSLLGAIIGSAVQWALVPVLSPLMPVPLDTALSVRAVCTGLAMGTGLTLLFALWPLLDVRRGPPALILRQDLEPRLPGRRPWLAVLPLAIGLGALSLWEAGSLKVGAIFIGGLVAPLILLRAGARLLIPLAPRLPPLAWLPLPPACGPPPSPP